jgi:6-pyruvoyltetrahydropterin/6-carboxytetrahydropterin synthase
MLNLTKIFNFEMAHAIQGYPGACKNIHGHSYELHVTVTAEAHHPKYIPAPGFILDFKELKQLVSGAILQMMDHKLVLSQAFLDNHPALLSMENLVIWEAEPTAENLLIYIREDLFKKLLPGIQLVKLKLYETKDSYAEWVNVPIFR